MAPEHTRNSDRNPASTTPHYTMKTSTRPQMGSAHSSHSLHRARLSQSGSQSLRPGNKSTTPLTSPRMAHSVGQPFPPAASKMSPVVTTEVRAPSSPNYFGLAVEPTEDRDSAQAPHSNWSPPTSSVKSFGAAIPMQMPLDANPEFEAFRRQADANRGQSFQLGSSHFAMQPPSTSRPLPPRRSTNQGSNPFDAAMARPVLNKAASSRMDIDTDSFHDSAYVSADSKRNSEGSLNAPSFFDIPQHESPVQTDSPFQPVRRSNLSNVEAMQPQLSMPSNRTHSPMGTAKPRHETMPTTLEGGPGLMTPAQLEVILTTKSEDEYLLLDVRVSTHYAQSRIKNALNLCIPTTLLKRATFDLQKLQKTLQSGEDEERFAQWRDAKYLIIYDSSSAEKRDAHSAMNMFKKFSNEGYDGNTFLLKGGFDAFSTSFPSLVDRRSPAERAGITAGGSDGRPSFAPVIGGVMLPTGSDNPNPFFGNIRQNMDLADGVGQMDIAVPTNLDHDTLPGWLQKAATKQDHGHAVSKKFLTIERNEQSRMKEAYTSFNSTTTQKPHTQKVQLSGIEKGGKNRYKDILPFEHARVHLSHKSEGDCDYINASHIRASRSNKRYIASQGPLPTTYNDFWSVIWDQDARVIVMLTAESEGGTLKCHPYWNGHDFGAIKLKPLSEKKISLDIDKHRTNSTASATGSPERSRRRAMTTTTVESGGTNSQAAKASTSSETPYVIIRKFAMSHAGHPFAPIREITQLHYPSWPDFGAPAQPSHLLALVELANVMQRSALPIDANAIAASALSDKAAQLNWYDEPEHHAQARPMVVHCSAGCGRTGTFCTVDSVIDMLKRQRMAALASGKRDNDGDIDMGEPVSPSSKAKNASNGGRRGVFKPSLDRVPSDSSVDIDWLRDDSLDLIEHTVEDFRGQRLSMVQSLRQFVLCYETVLEWIWRLQERSNPAMTTRARARSGSLEQPMRR
ncbi:hypothetical protein E8E14_003180 [Neopestalotiopsis sp. 37M]|nr:hypothetical protein E8E14_003180 [Neopestalotiopsis sp. 37M]